MTDLYDYPKNEMEDYQIEIDKIIKNQLSIKHSELLAEVEHLRKVVAKQHDDLQKASKALIGIEKKENDLIKRKEELEKDFFNKKFSEILNPEKVYYFPYRDSIEKEKCNLCDDKRQVIFKSIVDGREIKNNCNCYGRDYKHIVKEMKLHEVGAIYNTSGENYYNIYARDWKDGYGYSRLEIKYRNVLDVFDIEIIDKIKSKNVDDDILFTISEEAQKYCDYLNSKEN